MFKVKPIKAFIAGLLSLGLAFGFATAVQAPANAASLSGCTNANNGSTAATSCDEAIDMTVSPESVTKIASELETGVVVSTANLTFDGADFNSENGCTQSYAIQSSGSNLLDNGWAVNLDGASGEISFVRASGLEGPTEQTYDFTVTGMYECVITWTATKNFQLVISSSTTNTNNNQQSEPDRKVTICHRTHSVTNPYVRITVDYNSVNRPSGHQGHDEIFAGEHVFKAGIYKRAKDKDWGDIIPADPSGLNRWQPLNWTTLGEQIYNGTVAGCPSYDPVTYYNALREAGVPEGKIKAEIAQLETEQSEANPSRTETDETTLNYTGSSTKLRDEETDKVTICHATNATTNPYRKITVSAASITNKAGHYGHDDIYLTNHVFNSEVEYPANQKDWGDIIPADPTGQNRWQPLNWTPLGQKIYNGQVAGCGEQTTQEFYNELRESGLPKKEVVKDLKSQKSVDDGAKELDEIEYTGTDPQTERTEPKEPTLPAGKTVIDQSLSGIVWLDLNRDGLKDPDEPFMPNITLSVVQVSQINPASYDIRTAGVVRPAAVVTVKTDANGFYIFPSLGAGDWKVVTGIPDDLGVTYDSEGGPEGEVTTTVPVGSSAFTWVGLVGDTSAINEKLLEEILLEYPSSLPIEELPTWLQEKVTEKLAELEAAANGEALAYTGSEDLAWLFFGALLMLSGALALVAKRR